jgi:hypothetical protein
MGSLVHLGAVAIPTPPPQYTIPPVPVVQLPLPPVPYGGAIVSAAEAEAKKAAKDLAQRLGLPALPTSPEQLGKAMAAKITAELGIPVPTKLSVDGLLSAARAIPGLPFPLPAKLPTDAQEFVELGLQVAVDYFGPQLLAAVGLGNIVPGIGNAVGVAVALVAYLRFALEQEDLAGRYFCWPAWEQVGERRPAYVAGAQSQPGIDRATLLLTMARAQATVSEAKRVQGSPGEARWYQPEMVSQCITDLQDLIRYRYYPMVEGSVQKTTLPEAQRALDMFELARFAHPWLLAESERIMVELKNRLAHFQWLMSEHAAVTKASMPTDRLGAAERVGRVIALKVQLEQEMQNAAVSAQLSGPTQPYWHTQNVAQFALATAYHNQLGSLQVLFQARFDELGGGAPPPVRTEAEHQEQMRRWQEYERQTPYQPATASRIKPVYTGVQLAAKYLPRSIVLYQANKCAAVYDAWARAHASEAACLDVGTQQAIFGLCYAATTGKIKPDAMFARVRELIALACAREREPRVLVATRAPAAALATAGGASALAAFWFLI